MTSIRIFSPSDNDPQHAHWWGDHWARKHLEQGLIAEGWDIRGTRVKTDVSLHLHGAVDYPSDSKTKAVWIYSHPDLSASREFLSKFDYVYTLSPKHAKTLETLKPGVKVLLPATAKTYQPCLVKPAYDIIIMGNTAKTRRVRIVKDLIAAQKYKIGVVGAGWEYHIDHKNIIAPYWENEKYSALFNRTALTIYIHADDMQNMDFVAIRALDVIACSDCFVISDRNNGFSDLGLGDIPQFSNMEELYQLIDYYLQNPGERKQKTDNWRQIVQNNHTFVHRAVQLSNDLLKKPQSIVVPTLTSSIVLPIAPGRSVAVYLSTIHPLCYDLNIKFAKGMVEAFRELNFNVQLIHDPRILEQQHFDIVFCAAPSFQEDLVHQTGTTYIMYQSEQCPREDVFCTRASGFWDTKVSKELPKYDFIFEPFEDHIEYFRKLDYKNVVHFRVGYHPMFELNCIEEDKYDVLYVGHPAGEMLRRLFVLERVEKYLKTKQIRYRFPPLRQYYVVGDEYNKLLFSSKISLNIHFTHIRYFEYHKLIVDSFCNKRFMLSEEISHLAPFVSGQHLAVCNANDLENQISYYLENEKKRLQIAQNAYDFVKRDFTLVGNLKKALQECNLL